MAHNSHIDEVLYRLYNNMIPKQELRIGNSVMYDNRIFKISAITDEFPLLNTAEFGIGVVDWNNIHPIPITEEALLKMGFMKSGKNIYSLPKKYYLISLNDGECYIDISCTPFNSNLIKLTSIHQLCNLFYSLTQTELTYD